MILMVAIFEGDGQSLRHPDGLTDDTGRNERRQQKRAG